MKVRELFKVMGQGYRIEIQEYGYGGPNTHIWEGTMAHRTAQFLDKDVLFVDTVPFISEGVILVKIIITVK